MRKFILTMTLLALVAGLMVPAAEAKVSTRGLPKFLHSEASALDGKGDRNGIGMFKRLEENKTMVYAHGKVTAVSATSITVEVRSKKSDNEVSSQTENTNSSKNTDGDVVLTSYTFGVDATTKIIRKFKGTASIAEVAVGDKVKLWATKFEGGVAKLIWDKSIWWGSIKGTVTDVNTTAKTFKLVLRQKMTDSGLTKTVTATVKTHEGTTYWFGTEPVTAATFDDLTAAMNAEKKVTIRGSWNSVGKYFLASKVVITP